MRVAFEALLHYCFVYICLAIFFVVSRFQLSIFIFFNHIAWVLLAIYSGISVHWADVARNQALLGLGKALSWVIQQVEYSFWFFLDELALCVAIVVWVFALVLLFNCLF